MGRGWVQQAGRGQPAYHPRKRDACTHTRTHRSSTHLQVPPAPAGVEGQRAQRGAGRQRRKAGARGPAVARRVLQLSQARQLGQRGAQLARRSVDAQQAHALQAAAAGQGTQRRRVQCARVQHEAAQVAPARQHGGDCLALDAGRGAPLGRGIIHRTPPVVAQQTGGGQGPCGLVQRQALHVLHDCSDGAEWERIPLQCLLLHGSCGRLIGTGAERQLGSGGGGGDGGGGDSGGNQQRCGARPRLRRTLQGAEPHLAACNRGPQGNRQPLREEGFRLQGLHEVLARLFRSNRGPRSDRNRERPQRHTSVRFAGTAAAAGLRVRRVSSRPSALVFQKERWMRIAVQTSVGAVELEWWNATGNK